AGCFWRIAVGRDPQPAGRIHRAIVRHAEPAIGSGGGGERGADLGDGRVAAFQQYFPLALGGGKVATVFDQLDNVAEGVFGARIGSVDLVVLALGVVGQHDIDLAVHAVGLDVFGAVHLGRAEQVAGTAGLDHHIGLAGKAVFRR